MNGNWKDWRVYSLSLSLKSLYPHLSGLYILVSQASICAGNRAVNYYSWNILVTPAQQMVYKMKSAKRLDQHNNMQAIIQCDQICETASIMAPIS